MTLSDFFKGMFLIFLLACLLIGGFAAIGGAFVTFFVSVEAAGTLTAWGVVGVVLGLGASALLQAMDVI